jgi:hypothetical protein
MKRLDLFSRFKIVFNDEAYLFFKDVYEVLKQLYSIDSMILFDMDHNKCLSYGTDKKGFEIENWMEKYVDEFVEKDDIYYSNDCKNDEKFRELYKRFNASTSIFIPLKAILETEPNMGEKRVFNKVEDLININFKEKNAISEIHILQLGLLLNQYLIRYQTIKELKSFVNVNTAIYEETPYGLMVMDENFIANVNMSGREILNISKKTSMVCSRMGLCYYCSKNSCEYREKHLINIKEYFNDEQIEMMDNKMEAAFQTFEPQHLQLWFDNKFLRFTIVPFVLEEESLKKFYEDKDRKSVISAIISFQDITDTVEKQKLKRDLEIARKIQMNLLPKRELSINNYDIKAAYVPAQEVGGDYYDIIKLEDKNKLGIVIGDVSGKGIASALFVGELKGVINSSFSFFDNIRDIVLYINKYLRESKQKDFFVTSIIGTIDFDTNEFSWIRCGHNEPLYYNSKKKRSKYLKNPGIGLNLSNQNLFEKSIVLKKEKLSRGDVLLLYTDGIIERMDHNKEVYGMERLQKVFDNNVKGKSSDIVKATINDLEKFVEHSERTDDMTLLSIKLK